MTTETEQAAEAAAAEAAFAAGFSTTGSAADNPSPEPPPAPEPAPAPPEPAPPPADPAPVDPMASLPPEVRSALAAIPVLQQGFTELRRVTGHIPQIQSAVDKIAKSIPPPAPPAPPKFEKLEKLRSHDGLPEVADAIEEQVAHFQKQFAATTQPPAPEPSPSPAPATGDDLDDEAARMDAAVPDWRQVGGSAEFRAWAKKQKDGAAILNTTDPLVFANAIGRYQTLSASPAPAVNTARQARAAAAVVPNSTARPSTPATETPEDAFAKGFTQGRKRVSA